MRWGAGGHRRTGYRKWPPNCLRLRSDVIFAATTDAVVAVQQASPTVPIVFVGVIDPVGSGFITNMARPVDSAIGFTIFEYAIAANGPEFLNKLRPG